MKTIGFKNNSLMLYNLELNKEFQIMKLNFRDLLLII